MMGYSSLFLSDPSDEGVAVESADTQPYRLLFVDDEVNILNALRRVFRQENYEILLAQSAEQALRLMADSKHTPQLVMSDFKMPGMDGAQFLKQIKIHYPEVIRIMLTGHADSQAVMGAVNEGAVYKFILKPWNDDDLRVTISRALEQFDLASRHRELQKTSATQKKQLSSLSQLAINNRSQLATFLHKQGLLNDQQVQALYQIQQSGKHSMFRALLDKGWLSERQIREALRKQLMIEEVAIPEFDLDTSLADLIPSSFCKKQWVVPLKLAENHLMIAVADPMDEGLFKDLRFITGLQVDMVTAPVSDIELRINQLFGEGESSLQELETMVSTVDPYETIEVIIEEEDDEALEELLRSSEDPPAVRLVNAIIIEAVRMRVSDIHIHPRAKHVVVRYRIDGILQDKIHIPLNLLQPLVSRLKIMASLDISERRRPQDGRITVKTPMRIVDLRISSLPTVNGEKIVMRLLDRNASIYALDQLGFSAKQQKQVQLMVNQPQGIILATGPTGSGKTTTLYSMLQHTATPTKNFVTIEDPVEYYFDQAGQVNVHEKIDLTFAQVLRSILRQDPDVILLGEVRDFETAEVCFHAAMTGHLVYSTLHTNSALATIARLYDLGLKPYVLAYALTGIIAQRLLRRICEHCKTPRSASDSKHVLELLGGPFANLKSSTWQGSGCEHCNQTGYQGRAPIYEIIFVNDQFRKALHAAQSHSDLDALSSLTEGDTLIQSAYQRVVNGESTPEEVLRVLGPQHH